MTSAGAFLKVLGPLRQAFGESAEAAAQGLCATDLEPRCDECKSKGTIREDMGFMPSVIRPCDSCEATGYPLEARELRVRGHSLPELERMSIEEVLELWPDLEPVAAPLRVCGELGLGYLTLGQGAGTLSGGERQRLRLVRELSRRTTRPALYILDEPTAGLHGIDVDRLVQTLDAW